MKLVTIKVAAGIILRNVDLPSGKGSDQILIAKRAINKDQGGLWEFPGGKLEQYESPQEALARELKEEIGIEITDSELFGQIEHRYSQKRVKLWFFKVLAYSGQPKGMENQEIQWVKIDQLHRYEFPAANQPIVNQLLGKQVQ